MVTYSATVMALLTICTIRIAHGQGVTTHAGPSSGPEISLDSTKGPLLAQLAAAAKQARREGRTPVMELGTSDDPACGVVDWLIHDVSMAGDMKKMYVIHVDTAVWHSPLAKVDDDLITGLPTFKGRPLSAIFRISLRSTVEDAHLESPGTLPILQTL